MSDLRGDNRLLVITFDPTRSSILKTEEEDPATGKRVPVIVDWEALKALLPVPSGVSQSNVIAPESSSIPSTIIVVGGTLILEQPQAERRRAAPRPIIARTGPPWDRAPMFREDEGYDEEADTGSGGDVTPPKV